MAARVRPRRFAPASPALTVRDFIGRDAGRDARRSNDPIVRFSDVVSRTHARRRYKRASENGRAVADQARPVLLSAHRPNHCWR